MLLAAGADVNARTLSSDVMGGGRTALHNVVWKGRVDAVEVLIAGVSDVNAKTGYGATPLHFGAAGEGNWEKIVERILAAGADVEARTTAKGETPLHWAADSGRVAVVRILLAAGADKTVKATDGRSALDMAKFREHTKVIELLGNSLFTWQS